ncbi:MAG: response regulator [Chromatiaceae bacterium]|nr:response regulator [Gammaproteobacteria bacterium]MCB1862439.1 response regulator [Gammaproteobacteria bacterium]MCB1881395.1 response regulator [Gammaproteobacteria bacterium]MCB1904815.1 response regulator [Gammaproteobacteria bacterium]MCP5446321.1 response regulator [Chromatiaceae bacterium]
MNTPQDHILVVDDDPEIRYLLKSFLEKNGYQVSSAAEGDGMWRALEQAHIDLIVLDLMLPGTDGMELCRTLRAGSRIPVIMLTARGDEMDRILGLEMGADDYLAKPFSARELMARIKVVLRRVREMPADPLADVPEQLAFSGWRLDTRTQYLTSPDGVVVPLSSAEYRLLQVLLTHPNRALTRDQLLDMTQGRDAGPFDRSIDVLIGRLRKRLGDDAKQPELIRTVRGRGYLLASKVSPAR